MIILAELNNFHIKRVETHAFTWHEKIFWWKIQIEKYKIISNKKISINKDLKVEDISLFLYGDALGSDRVKVMIKGEKPWKSTLRAWIALIEFDAAILSGAK